MLGRKFEAAAQVVTRRATKISSDREVRGRTAISAGPVFAICRYWRRLQKAILYSAHTWRDRPPLIRRAVARSVENRNSRAMPVAVARWRVYFGH